MRVLYIDIDSLRPDHLGCYGYHRETSPHIDGLARQGVRFDNFYATDTPCLPSRTALFSGRFGTCTGVVNHGGVYADMPLQGEGRGFRAAFSQESLASVLRRAGYHTASISPFPNRHSAYQVWHGFTETYDTGKGGLENADEMWPPIERWLKANGGDDDWFLHVNLWDPHTPYDHPEEFGNPFAGQPMDDWITPELLARQNASFGPHSSLEVPGLDDQLPPRWRMGRGAIRTLEDAKAHMDGYDTGIRYADHYVGRMLALLDELGIGDETAVIVSADHGENQGELNVWGDHQTADHICNRIPLVVHWPGITDGQGGRVCGGLQYNLDLSATLAELLGGQAPDAWNGASFAKTLKGGDDGGRDFLVLSQGAWSCQRSVRWDDWLLVRTYHTGLKEFPEYMLFDIAADPHETDNLAGRRPAVLGEGLRRMDQWMAERMADGLRGDPFWGVIAEGGPLHANERSSGWAQYLERLRQTGRADHARRLAASGGRPLSSGLE